MMNTDKNMVRSVVQSCVKVALSVFKNKGSGDALTDLYIKIDEDNGKMEVYDDMENFLTESVLKSWAGSTDDPERAVQLFVKAAKSALNELNREGVFDVDFIFKPFSVALVDEHFIVIEELLFLDDDTLALDGEFLQGLDKDLNDFLDNLMN